MNHPNPSCPALLKAIGLAGSQSELARLIGKSQPLIGKWLKSPNPVRPENCSAIARVFPGKVTVCDLRPDDWHLIWPELAQQKEIT